MITQNRGTIAFAVCGSFCTLEAALQSARALTAQGWQLLPVMSFAARQDTRFGTGNYWKEQLEAAAGHPVLDTLQAVEPLGPRRLAQALVVAPCTGATLGALLGIMKGMDGIPQDWRAYIGDGIKSICLTNGHGRFPQDCTELTDCLMNLLPVTLRVPHEALMNKAGWTRADCFGRQG